MTVLSLSLKGCFVADSCCHPMVVLKEQVLPLEEEHFVVVPAAWAAGLHWAGFSVAGVVVCSAAGAFPLAVLLALGGFVFLCVADLQAALFEGFYIPECSLAAGSWEGCRCEDAERQTDCPLPVAGRCALAFLAGSWWATHWDFFVEKPLCQMAPFQLASSIRADAWSADRDCGFRVAFVAGRAVHPG